MSERRDEICATPRAFSPLLCSPLLRGKEPDAGRELQTRATKGGESGRHRPRLRRTPRPQPIPLTADRHLVSKRVVEAGELDLVLDLPRVARLDGVHQLLDGSRLRIGKGEEAEELPLPQIGESESQE